MVSYRVMLDVPPDLVRFVSGLLAARRREIGTRKGSRKLGCYRQALFALAWFRDKGDIPRPGARFGLPQSTAYRYLDEVAGVLAAQAPGLQEALERALAEGAPYLILDGKVVAADRCCCSMRLHCGNSSMSQPGGLFLAELPASFTRVASGHYRVRAGARRFSELDPVRLAGLLDRVPQAERPGVYRRLGDVTLY